MKDREKRILDRVIEKEGFDYAMTDYSAYNGDVNFNHITDDKFHELLAKFLKYRNELADFCRENTSIKFNI